MDSKQILLDRKKLSEQTKADLMQARREYLEGKVISFSVIKKKLERAP
jgi:hypothetical protein